MLTFKEAILNYLDKLGCKHDWKKVETTVYVNYDKHLFICQKCGKMKIKKV